MNDQDVFGQPSLFDSVNPAGSGPTSEPRSHRPLAHRMRPDQLDSYFGHHQVLGPKSALRQWIETDRVPSIILWGPPGCGKTTLARVIARSTQSIFHHLSAVQCGVKEVREIVDRALEARRMTRRKTLLFLDEIHRFNKSQQDALLPHVENGTLTLIGATTENPSFSLNHALLSRLRVIRLEGIDADAMKEILSRALSDPEKGLGGWLMLSSDAMDWIIAQSEGDARKALTLLETITLSAEKTNEPLGIEALQKYLETSLNRQPIAYDRSGEEHYNVISAFIKSIRDSDVDAGLYYLARMIEGGEDPLFIMRRLVILASEDVGMADPQALGVVLAAKEAVEFVGMPEGRIPMAQAVVTLAQAPKSNASYMAINRALEEVQKSGALPVPLHLRNAPTQLMKSQGYGKGYLYVHDRPEAKTQQAHLPSAIQGKKFYQTKA